MKKFLFSILIILITISSFAQQIRQIQIVSSERLVGLPQKGLSRIIKPIFSHEGSTLSADSANFNQTANTFEAFGNVVITQSNGTTVYADQLNYNGNNRLARLSKNVRLVDNDATLTTDFLTYNMATRVGTYVGGGKIVNGPNVLTSKNGYYFSNSRDAYFRYNVVVTTPDATIKSDTLRYNSGSKIAYFYGPTNIKGSDDNLYTENGEYNTTNDQARFGKRNLYQQGSKFLNGDSLFYDRRAGYGRAVKNITFLDTAEKIILKGNLGLYKKADESILVTQNAYVVLASESDSTKTDSIYMTADTLFSKVVLTKSVKAIPRPILRSNAELLDPGAVDSAAVTTPDSLQKPAIATKTTAKETRAAKRAEVKAKTGTATSATSPPAATSTSRTVKRDTADVDTNRNRIVLAYHKVRLFKSDLQARADSVFFSYSDSTLRCYVNPMLWSQGSQLSGDTIYLQLKNRKLDNMLIQNKGFIVNTEQDSSKYNQVKGKILTGFFVESKLDRMFVDGNAESIYYVLDSNKYVGMNRTLASRMRVSFKDRGLREVMFYRKPEGTTYPIDKIPQDRDVLEGFIWKPNDRPKSKEEIIPTLAKPKASSKPKTAPAKPTPKKQPAKKS